MTADMGRSARFRLWECGAPGPYPGPVTLFLAEEKRSWREHVPADQRWAEVGVEVERVPVPGNHLTLMAEPHVGVLAERLRARL